MAGEAFTFSEIDLPAAIRGLALGRSTEAMAELLGCSSVGYEKWEQGTAVPSAEWLLRMLQLCPDEQTWNAFRIRPERRRKPREMCPRLLGHFPGFFRRGLSRPGSCRH